MSKSDTAPTSHHPAAPLSGVRWLTSTRLAAVLLALGFGYLVWGLPYAAGYGDYRKSIATWLRITWADPTWQHGALAPLIAGFMVWRVRGRLAQLKVEPSLLGLLGIIFFLATFWIGYRGNFYYIGYASIHLLIASVVVWLWGWRHLMTMGFAWLILGFTWPYLFLEDTLAFKLRYLMVTATSWTLNHVGVGTVQDGTRLISAAAGEAHGSWFDLNVDGPCSGLRSLFALMMVSALYGYFRQRSLWRRSVLFALSIPLAVAANMVRILILIFGSMAFGQNFAVGRGEEYTSNFHLLAGVFVFIVGLGGLVSAEELMNRLFKKEKPLTLLGK